MLATIKTSLWHSLQIICAVIVLSTAYTTIDNEINEIKYLGAVEGKGYFADSSTTRNWTDARAYCGASGRGLRLASINTTAQRLFLENARDTNYFPLDQIYWTAGRSGQQFISHALFVWDHNNGTLNPEAVPWWSEGQADLKIDVCLRYRNRASSFFYAANCSDLYYTLCEVDIGY